MKNFYMDDLFNSEKDKEIAVNMCQDLTNLLSKGGFRLTKWCSNSREVLSNIRESELAPCLKGLDLDGKLPTERALGALWNMDEDSFVFTSCLPRAASTRRQIPSVISSMFDPLGMIAPYILQAKLFFQALWQMKQGWDEPIPPEHLAPFLEAIKELDDLTSFRESRFYRSVATIPLVIQVHVFGDASLDAFCAVGYFRFLYPDGSIQCCFIMGRTRVAPLRQLSIPKLELQAVLCVRLLNVIKTEHTYEISSCYLWTDSTTALQWIRSHSRRHPTFIANRIAEIQDDSDPSEW